MHDWMEGENKGWLWVSRNVECESAGRHHSTSICLLLSLMSWWEMWYSKLMCERSHQLGLFFLRIGNNNKSKHRCPASLPLICLEGWMRGSRLLGMSQKLFALGNKSISFIYLFFLSPLPEERAQTFVLTDWSLTFMYMSRGPLL